MFIYFAIPTPNIFKLSNTFKNYLWFKEEITIYMRKYFGVNEINIHFTSVVGS